MPLKILALETSGLYGSAALAEDGQLVAEAAIEPPTRSAQGLTPLLDRLLRSAGWRPVEIGLVAVIEGPGSFTGLRVGLATAKVFAYAGGTSVLGIDAFAAIASAMPNTGEIERLAIVADAQRGQLLTAHWRRDAEGQWREESPASLRDVDRWLARLSPGDVVAGPALALGRPKLADSLPTGVTALSEDRWMPTAATVARLAWRDFQAGRRDSLWALVPRYHRPSAAEEVKGAEISASAQASMDSQSRH
jgi:tRNA threonylcarbamoyladenosine biosynthesis protein TsaB